MNAVRMGALALLALSSLLLSGPIRAVELSAASPVPPVPDSGCAQQLVVVTVWPQRDMPPALLTSYQYELNRLLDDLGVCPRFVELSEATSRSFAGRIVLLRMLQPATARHEREGLPRLPRKALAWTHASGHDVTPFGAVDLAALRAFLRMPDTDLPTPAQARLEGMAIARVSAHEIYHMLTRSKTHCAEGLMRAGLTREELLAPHAPAWTSENRQQVQAHQPASRPVSMAAVRGAQSKAASGAQSMAGNRK